ncbi:hypothetical protein BLOT_001510, partial [Blomia tropicalis]
LYVSVMTDSIIVALSSFSFFELPLIIIKIWVAKNNKKSKLIRLMAIDHQFRSLKRDMVRAEKKKEYKSLKLSQNLYCHYKPFCLNNRIAKLSNVSFTSICLD